MVAAHGVVSLFRDQGFTDERTVHAFNDQGEALVLEDGRLWIAADLPGFIRTIERGAPVGVLPGDGWTARYRYHDRMYESPVVGFVVDDDGISAALLHVDGDSPMVVRDDWPGVELLELHAPVTPKLVMRDWPDVAALMPGNGGR